MQKYNLRKETSETVTKKSAEAKIKFKNLTLSKLNHLNAGWLGQTIKSVGREAFFFFFCIPNWLFIENSTNKQNNEKNLQIQRKKYNVF